MVRFHWHVEDGSGASIPHGSMAFHKDTAVQHINCNIEIPGEPHAQACITVPRGYLTEPKVKEIGILLGHDTPESWDGPLLTGIAVALAEAGGFYRHSSPFTAQHLASTNKQLWPICGLPLLSPL